MLISWLVPFISKVPKISKDYKKFKCKCGQEYTFINWNENHLLGLNKSRKDNL